MPAYHWPMPSHSYTVQALVPDTAGPEMHGGTGTLARYGIRENTYFKGSNYTCQYNWLKAT